MKLTQTWGWLAAGVLAAGLNASYHDGGLEWAHRIADRAQEASSVVHDLAAGRADLFLTEARLFLAGDDSSSRLATVLTRVQTKLDRTNSQVVRAQATSDCRQAVLDRAEAERDRMKAQRERVADEMEANRERIEAKIEANRVRVEARMVKLRIPANFAPVIFNPPQPPSCPRVRMSMPRLPRINISVPAVHIEEPRVDPI
jgi:hypothetical protein